MRLPTVKSKQNPNGTARLFTDGHFYTANGKAKFVAITPHPPQYLLTAKYPFTLNTGRIRDQWHTMTRTSLSAKLNAHRPEPLMEIHPHDARRLNLRQSDLAQIESRWGSMLARVDISNAQQLGSLFLPMHWTRQFSSQGGVGVLVNPVVDPVSGQPESKQTPVNDIPWPVCWQALVLSRQPLVPPICGYWIKSKGDHYSRYHFADKTALDDLTAWSRGLLKASVNSSPVLLEYWDERSGDYRCAQIAGQQLESCVFITASGELPEPAWLCSLFAKTALTRKERLSLLSGLPPEGDEDVGRMVCSCFNVGEKTIRQAIESNNLSSVAAIGHCIKVGTGCGSCLPELKQMLVN